jgi:DNA polymerase Ligase (LigD)
MPRFVLLLHECPDEQPRETHCDLMLECDSVLRTWAIPQVPRAWNCLGLPAQMLSAANTVEARRIADHRLDYLHTEGEISGNRGRVRRLEEGTYRVGALPTTFRLDGQVVRGDVEIAPHAGDQAQCTLRFRAVENVSQERLTDS